MRPMERIVLSLNLGPAFVLIRRTIDTRRALLALSDAEAAARPPRQMVANRSSSSRLGVSNHGRFVRAQLQDDMTFSGYEQDEWVRVQAYQERKWADLVLLWQAFNHHIAHVMEAAGAEALAKPREATT